MQLFGKVLIKLFNSGMCKLDIANAIEGSPCNMPNLKDFDPNKDIFDEGDTSGLKAKDEEDDNEGKGKGEILSKEEHLLLLSDTLTVFEMVTKVCVIISV